MWDTLYKHSLLTAMWLDWMGQEDWSLVFVVNPLSTNCLISVGIQMPAPVTTSMVESVHGWVGNSSRFVQMKCGALSNSKSTQRDFIKRVNTTLHV